MSYQLNCEIGGVERTFVSDNLEKLREIFLDMISYEKLGYLPDPFFFNRFSLFEINELDVKKFLDKE